MNSPSTNQAPSAEILSRLSDAQDLLFDVDETLIVNQGTIEPELAGMVMALPQRAGLCTSRCVSEAHEIFEGTGYHLRGLLSGPTILEDGALAILPGKTDPELIADRTGYDGVRQLMAELERQLVEVPGEAKWRRLANLDAPLVRIPMGYEASGTVWEKGPQDSPLYAHVMAKAVEAAERLGVRDAVSLLEIGNGTLRVTIPGTSKGQALITLAERGVLDISRLAYFGDGRNDVPAAKVVKERGGLVVAVAPYCEELVALADLVTPQHGPAGLKWLFSAALARG